MKFLRDLGHDLVDKRLWPVAAVLAIALIAIPLVVKSSPADPSPTPAGAARGGDATGPAAAVTGKDPKRSRLRVRSARDPFGQPFASRSAAQQGDGTATPASGGSSGAGSGSAAASGAGGGSSGSGGGETSSGGGDAGTGGASAAGDRTDTARSTTAPADSARRQASSAGTWTVDLRFGPVGKARKLKAVRPGAVVAGGDEPLLTFVGGRSEGETARFLLSAGVSPESGGDGVCSPSPDLCRTLTMRAGQTRTLDVATASGTTTYVLETRAIRRR